MDGEKGVPKWLSCWTILKCSVNEFIDDDMSSYASALAYQALFSLFPFLFFLISLFSYLQTPDFFVWLQEQTALMMPPQAIDTVNEVILQLQKSHVSLISSAIIIAVWSASGGVRSTMNALNNAYGVKENRPAWKRIPLSVFYTIGLALLMLLAAAMMVVGPSILNWLATKVGIERFVIVLWSWLHWPLAAVTLVAVVTAAYAVAPDVEQKFRFILPGGLLAVAGWISASLAFGWYVRNFADYNAIYGGMGAVIILLLYFYLSSVVFLFGAEVNAVIEHRSTDGKSPGDKKLPQIHGSRANQH